MFTTDKEIHIYLEQRIQQITSNRHGSIAPQVYDMFLNSCAIKNIQSKTNSKTNYKREGSEESKKRVDDFQSLKRKTKLIPLKIISDNKGYIDLPSDYLKCISSSSNVLFSKFNKTIKDKISITETFKILNIFTFDFNTPFEKIFIVVDDLHIEITHLIHLAKESNGVVDYFEFTNHFLDLLRKKNINVYWEYFNGYHDKCFIIKANDLKLYGSNKNEKGKIINVDLDVIIDDLEIESEIFKTKGSSIKPNDLVSSEIVTDVLNNYYLSKNRHLNPISEIENDRLYVYYFDNFIVSDIELSYYKKPNLFSIETNSISDMEVTPEFLELVISDILLTLKDESFQYINNNSKIE